MNAQHTARRSIVYTILGTVLLLGLLVSPAFGSADSARQQGPRSVTIPAGGSVTLQSRAFCQDFGKDFPTAEISAKGLADSKIRAALNYAISKGYAETNPTQVELAVWFLRDNTWHGDQHTVAQEILDNATTPPNDSGDGISIVDAVAQNKASATAKYVPQTKDNFYGDGQITIKNLTNADLKVFMPIGVVFAADSGNFQGLVAYETGTEVTEVQGTPVVSPAVPTVTLQPTVAATLTPVLDTPVPQPTDTVAAPTSAPTEAPTSMPTGTGGQDLPASGNGESTVLLVSALALAAMFLVIAGVVFSRRPAR